MATVDVNGANVEMTEDDALDLVDDIIQTFGFIGSVFSRNDAELAIDRPISDDEWLQMTNLFDEDVYRFVMEQVGQLSLLDSR